MIEISTRTLAQRLTELKSRVTYMETALLL